MTNDQIRAATSEALTVVKQKMASEGRVYPAPLARPAVIISAALVSTKHRATELCADCDRPIYSRPVRVVWKQDGSVQAHYYHPDIDQDEEIRGCAPDHEIVRAALRRAS